MLAVLTMRINQSAHFSLYCLFFFLIFASFDAQLSARSSYVLSVFFTSVVLVVVMALFVDQRQILPWASSTDPRGASESLPAYFLSLLLLVKSREAELIFSTD
jgi:hypothetical protein